MSTRRDFFALAAAASAAAAQPRGIQRFVRFRAGAQEKYGLLEGDTVRELPAGIFGAAPPTRPYKLADVTLLYPCKPQKVLAVGRNYKSHVGDAEAPKRPELFYKPITCLQNPGGEIVIPPDAKNVHYEGELVIIIGARLKNATPAQAKDGIFGVTCGNDVSERDWQGGPDKDMQWWRAKGADTFGPMGPAIVRGLDYSRLLLQTRLNRKVVQKQSTADLIYDCPTIVSFASRYVTLMPGDAIFTGTPGTTAAMKPGDVVEVEIEGIGVLRNKVVAG
jgi:2-keto-4-pentenoate hydratase/2-oxohepta-3-ene-1,7-dioic acid hydratase in catechol pathway